MLRIDGEPQTHKTSDVFVNFYVVVCMLLEGSGWGITHFLPPEACYFQERKPLEWSYFQRKLDMYTCLVKSKNIR